MSARKLKTAIIGNQFLSEVESLMVLKKGLHSLSLTNMTNTLKPQIEADSYLELNGTVYLWDYLSEIEGGLSDYVGMVYIRTNNIVNEGEEQVSIIFDSALSPLDINWIKNKKGWYDSAGNRIIARLSYDGTSAPIYRDKKFLLTQ